MIERIAHLISQKSIKASKMASDLGFDTGAVSNWKSGRAKPSTDAIIKMADYFGVTADYLLGISESPSPQMLDVPKALQQVRVAFEDVDELSQEQVDKIAEYTKFILSQSQQA